MIETYQLHARTFAARAAVRGKHFSGSQCCQILYKWNGKFFPSNKYGRRSEKRPCSPQPNCSCRNWPGPSPPICNNSLYLRPLPRNPIIISSLLLDETHLSTTQVKGSDSLSLGVKVNMKGPPPPPFPLKLVVRVDVPLTMATPYRSVSARSRSVQTEKWQNAGRGCTVETQRCRLLGGRTTFQSPRALKVSSCHDRAR